MIVPDAASAEAQPGGGRRTRTATSAPTSSRPRRATRPAESRGSAYAGGSSQLRLRGRYAESALATTRSRNPLAQQGRRLRGLIATPRTTPRARSAPATWARRTRSGIRSTCWAARASSGSRSIEQLSRYTGDPAWAARSTRDLPETYLFFDRLDNPGPRRRFPFNLPPKGTVWNDRSWDPRSWKDPKTGSVDLLTKPRSTHSSTARSTRRWLPSAGFAYRPEQIEGPQRCAAPGPRRSRGRPSARWAST